MSWRTDLAGSGLAVRVLTLFGLLSARSAEPLIKVGGYYSVPSNRGGFCVMKVLVVDSNAVHVRVYSDHFVARPKRLDPAMLSLKPGKDPGCTAIGHLPVTRAIFLGSDPEFVQQADVSDAELDGYREWQIQGGGYFGTGDSP